MYLPLAEVKKNEFATNENGIHISPKIESVLMNIYMQSSIHGWQKIINVIYTFHQDRV